MSRKERILIMNWELQTFLQNNYLSLQISIKQALTI